MDNIPYGYCHCGCGQKTNLAPQTHKKYGWVKGEPLRYIKWHKRPPASKPKGPYYLEEDRGYKSACWIWQRSLHPSGYGNASDAKGKTVRAHRLYYERACGPVPPNLQLDHLCRQRDCCRPSHLEPVTQQENQRRGNKTKLNMQIAEEIRERYAEESLSYDALAKIYNVSDFTIGQIIRGERWS